MLILKVKKHYDLFFVCETNYPLRIYFFKTNSELKICTFKLWYVYSITLVEKYQIFGRVSEKHASQQNTSGKM
jgi:hypothetical protein